MEDFMTLRFRRLSMFVGIWLTFVVFVTTFLPAQSTSTGTVVGVVTDQTGAAIPGAVITLTDLDTKEVHTEKTSKSGQYIAVNLPPGQYKITAQKDGFSLEEVASETVSVGSQSNANFKLAVGGANETIEVTETNADLQTLNSTVGTTVNETQIDNLPAIGRDVSTFLTLQPGVSPEGSVAGTVVDQASFQLDGGNNSSDMDGSNNVYNPTFAGDPTGGFIGGAASGAVPTPVDSVEEFKSNTANQTADFDNSSGAQIQLVTRRGTDRIHGTVYEYYLDNNKNANSWQNNYTGTPVVSYLFNRFGAAAGGPIIPKKILGGKTYLFGNYEGFRFPSAETYERSVPSPAMRQGIVTFGGTTYNLKTIDPRGIGIAPDVAQLWNTYEPTTGIVPCGGLSGSGCDDVNTLGFQGTLKLPERSDFAVARLDHDFGDKNHFMASWRYFRQTRATDSQVDIGGGIAGDKLGVPTALSNRPENPSFYITQLTTQISARLSNDFHYNYTRNYWSWNDAGAPPQITGLGGVLEPGGETASTVLAPYNVNTQSIRTRFWDGHDNFLSDNLTYFKGNHFLQFGGQYQHNWDYHQRTDNGGGINYTTTYQLGGGSNGANGFAFNGLQANGYPNTKTANLAAAEILGIVTASQVAYTRAGNDLSLNPPLTPAADKVTIPFYNVYFSDTWKIKPALTVTYGLGYALEMPPTEASGKQVVVVDDTDQPVDTLSYFAQRKAAASLGEVYNPEIGFSLVHNVANSPKYPYQPFYGSLSPRLAAAWNPKFDSQSLFGRIFGTSDTVIRGGYGRVYGRLNGVDLVLVPLLGVGLIQPVQCTAPLKNGTCGASGSGTDATGFRIGVDGPSAPLQAAQPTLPQPLYPGYNSGATSAAEGLDPHFRPNVVDSFDLTIQRQIKGRNVLEVGYIGRIIKHEYQPYNLNAVPYMMSQGGQTFASAYAALETGLGCATSAAKCGTVTNPNVAPQPFFETALGGANSLYCTTNANGMPTTYGSCTAAVLAKEGGNLLNQDVWHLWSDLDNDVNGAGGAGFMFPRSMMNTPIPSGLSSYGANGVASSGIALNASTGYGNYNGGFVTFKTSNWHGLTAQANFTYSKALGTGAVVQASSEYTPNDPFNLGAMYGLQYYNHKFIGNTFLVWQTPWFKKQEGLIGRALGGWTAAPIFVAGSGAPLYCNTNTDSSSFGAGDGNNYFDNEQCVFTSKYTEGVHTHRNIAGSTDAFGNSVGTQTEGPGEAAINMFTNPAAVFDQVRAPILGIDTKNPGQGAISGLPYWNMDLSLTKSVNIVEGVKFEFTFISTNVLNHLDFGNPGQAIYSPATWGVVTGQGNTPRQMQFGGRIRY
jgi:hypothetical protein